MSEHLGKFDKSHFTILFRLLKDGSAEGLAKRMTAYVVAWQLIFLLNVFE
jgi:hypothetical protein